MVHTKRLKKVYPGLVYKINFGSIKHATSVVDQQAQKTFAIDNSKFEENDYDNLNPINDDYYAPHYSQQIKFLKHKFSFLVPKMFTQKPQKQTRANTLFYEKK